MCGREDPIVPCVVLQGSNVFAGKYGLITPRDLFKWASRGAVTYEQLAENGFMLLGERLRAPEEREVVRKVLESVMNVKVRFRQSTRASPHPEKAGWTSFESWQYELSLLSTPVS